jgi:hypothetical protein
MLMLHHIRQERLARVTLSLLGAFVSYKENELLLIEHKDLLSVTDSIKIIVASLSSAA